MSEFFAPALVEKIIADIQSKSTIPEGWLSISEMEKNFDVGRSFILTELKKYRNNKFYAGKFKKFFKPKGNEAEYFHPDLVKAIEKKSTAAEPAPKGWMARGTIQEKYGLKRQQIDNAIKFYADEVVRHQWLKDFMSDRKVKLEFLHPDLIELVLNKVKSDSAKGG